MMTFLYLFSAFVIDKVGIGPKWLQSRVTFCLVVAGFSTGLNGTIVDVIAYRLVARLTLRTADLANSSEVIKFIQGNFRADVEKIDVGTAGQLVGMVCFILTLYALLCLAPDGITKFFITKKNSWFNFPGGKGIDPTVWIVGGLIALLADVPGQFHLWNSTFVSITTVAVPAVANFLWGLIA